MVFFRLEKGKTFSYILNVCIVHTRKMKKNSCRVYDFFTQDLYSLVKMGDFYISGLKKVDGILNFLARLKPLINYAYVKPLALVKNMANKYFNNRSTKSYANKILVLIVFVFILEFLYINYLKEETNKDYEIFHQLQALKSAYRELEMVFDESYYKQRSPEIMDQTHKFKNLLYTLPQYVHHSQKYENSDFNKLYETLKKNAKQSEKLINTYSVWNGRISNTTRMLHALNRNLYLLIENSALGLLKKELIKMVSDIDRMIVVMDDGADHTAYLEKKLKKMKKLTSSSEELTQKVKLQHKYVSQLLQGYKALERLENKNKQLSVYETIEEIHTVFFNVITQEDRINQLNTYILNAFVVILLAFLFLTQKKENQLHTKVHALNQDLNQKIKELKRVNYELGDIIGKFDQHVIASKTDARGMITYASDAFCKISKYSKEELLGKPHSIVRHPHMPHSVYVNLWKVISSGQDWRGEIKNLAKDGSSYWVEIFISPIFDYTNSIVGYSAIRQDITAKKALEALSHSLESEVFSRTKELEAMVAKVEKLSITDELTQLYNRRYYAQIFEGELKRSKRNKELFNYMLLDLDYFKLYNDSYGHQSGDKALQKVSELFRRMLNRPNDFVFRMGGEEFVIIFSSTNKAKAIEFAQNIVDMVSCLDIEHLHNKPYNHLTVSAGLVSCPFEGTIMNENIIYTKADKLLYQAKAEGRNCMKF